MKRQTIVHILTACLLIISAFSLCSCGEAPHVHTLTKVSAVSATCETAGNEEYYTCTCGKYFSDENGNTEIDKNSWIVEALSHEYQVTEYYDNDNLHAKKKVCSRDTAHTVDNLPVALSPEEIDGVINDEDLAKRNWSSYNILLEGDYERFVLEYAGLTSEGDGTATNPFIYNREMDTVSFVGNGAVTLAGFTVNAGYAVRYNPVEYINRIYTIDTLEFKNITFTEELYLGGLNNDYTDGSVLKIKNIVLDGVTFDFADSTKNSGAMLHIISQSCGIESLTVKNCTFKNTSSAAHAVLIDTRNADNINIEFSNNAFADANNNAIQLSGSGSAYGGNIVIKDNAISNTGDRPIRISKIASSAVVEITGNIMVNASDDDGEMLKASVETGASITVSGNYWDAKGELVAVKGLVNPDGENILDDNPLTTAD